MLNHESLLVRSAALIALGEIALFRGNLDLDVVLPEMKRFENDPALGPFVEDALDNIRVAKRQHVQLRRYKKTVRTFPVFRLPRSFPDRCRTL
jgi:hypothetical protein